MITNRTKKRKGNSGLGGLIILLALGLIYLLATGSLRQRKRVFEIVEAPNKPELVGEKVTNLIKTEDGFTAKYVDEETTFKYSGDYAIREIEADGQN